MQNAKRICFYCLHKIWIAIAIALVVLATLVSALRIALPYADSYRHQIEQMLTQQLGSTVAIKQITATWQKTGPALVLQQVSIQNADQLQLDIAETAIQLDFWQSIIARQFRAAHFELTGLRYWVDVETIFQPKSTHTVNTSTSLHALENVFFRRLQDFTIKQSQLILQSATQPDLVLEISHLNWRNEGMRHQGEGELTIANVTANSLVFRLDLQGPSLAEVTGQLYLQSTELDILPFFRQRLPHLDRLEKARINFAAWAQINQGVLQNVQVELADNSLHWQRDSKKQQLQFGSGQLLWQPTEEGWQMISGELRLATDVASWAGMRLAISQHQHSVSAQLQHFQLDALEPLAQLFTQDNHVAQRLLAHKPTGYLEQLNMVLEADQYRLSGKFNELGLTAAGNIPGLQHLTGEFWLGNEFGWLLLEGEQNQIAWDGLFLENWHYQQLQADVRLRLRDQQWQVSIPALTLHANDFTLEAQASLSLGAQPELALLAQLTGLDAAKASMYYPQRFMPAKTRDYLSQAIESGSVEQATVVWHGAFNDFPFTDSTGHFQVRADLRDGVFQFAPDWPSLTELSAVLWFENASMLIEGHRGYLGELPLNDVVTARIPNLFAASQLDINVNTEINTGLLTRLMLQSPLQNSLGKTLQHLGLEGIVQGQLLLEIGLNTPSVIASGTAELLNIEANIQAPNMALNNLTGRVHFRNDVLQAEQLQFSWQGVTAQGDFNGENTSEAYQLAINLAGQIQADTLTTSLDPLLNELAVGLADWQLHVALALPQNGFTYQADLQVNLEQMALNLPVPYQKKVAEPSTLSLVAHGNTEQSFINADYQQALHFQAELPHNTGRINRAQLSLGKTNPGLRGEGFNIEVNLPYVEFSPWFALLQPLLSRPTTGPALLPALREVRGKVAHIQLPAKLALTHTIFDLTPSEAAWQLNLHGTELASRWQFFNAWQSKGIDVQFDYLHLPLTADETRVTLPDVRLSSEIISSESIPTVEPELQPQNWLVNMVPLQLTCNDCSVGNYRFGQVQLEAAGQGDTWRLQQFVSEYKGSTLTIAGDWQPNAGLGISQFSGKFKSPNMGALLAEYQLSSAISGSRSDIDFKFAWEGAPQQFRVKALDGNVTFALGDGVLTEVSDQGARLFSLFSLDSLVRKLRLDFRDVFSKGFYYNKMTGTLNVYKGVAQTNDFSIDGVPGNLTLQGYADLSKKQLDYQMSFAPKVTSSLPVIIAWMVNPATGLAALALDEVFQSAEVISRINFTVTGSFDKPVVTEVNRHSTEIPVPVRIAQPETLPKDDSQLRTY